MKQNKRKNSEECPTSTQQTQHVMCKLMCDYVQEKHAYVLKWKKVSDMFFEKKVIAKRNLPKYLYWSALIHALFSHTYR